MRARGEGSLYTESRRGRPDRYVVQVSLPDGRFHKRRFPHTDEGKAAAVKYLQDTSPAAAPVASSSLGAYLAAWTPAVRATVSPKTWRGYEQIVRLWLIPSLGKTRLDRLSVAQVRSYLFALPLAAQTAHHHRAVLRKALADAVTDGMLTRNVAAMAKPPTVPRTERRWLSGDELGRLFDATAGTRHHGLWVLAGTTGLRSAELLALSWSDVDLEDATVRVRHTLHRADGGWVFRPTKTRATRVVPLSGYAVGVLRSHYARQAAETLGGGSGRPSGLVFTTSTGAPIHGADVSRFLRRDLIAAGLPVVTAHALRHSCASFLLATGTPIQVIASLLGHSTPAVTAALYAHVGEDMKRAAIERMQEAMR